MNYTVEFEFSRAPSERCTTSINCVIEAESPELAIARMIRRIYFGDGPLGVQSLFENSAIELLAVRIK